MMHDLVLSEDGHAIQADDYDEDDYYETQTSNVGYRPRRGNYAIGMILLGAVMIFGGLSLAMIGKEEQDNFSKSSKSKTSVPAKNRGPTLPPSPTQTTYLPTVSPTTLENGFIDYLKKYVPQSDILNEDSYAGRAFTWLLSNTDAPKFAKHQIRQRFSLASIYYATNNEDLSSWKRKSGWVTEKDECKWDGVKCNNDGYVVGLNLTKNGLKGLVPHEIKVLQKSLLALDVSSNSIENADEELRWIGELTNLRLLNMEDTNVKADGIPSYIGKLTDMRILDVANTFFLGQFQEDIFEDLEDLIYLDIGDNLYNMTVPTLLTELPNLKALYAYDCGLEGKVQEFVPRFKHHMFELWMDNNNLRGTLPTQLGAITGLASLSLSDNAITGTIPTEIGNLVDMEQMWLYGNYLTGDIPTEIGSMAKLKILGLEDNDLDGAKMPTEICDLNLVDLGADCKNGVKCDCCTCCQHPCPVTSMRVFDHNARFLLDDPQDRFLLGLD